VCTNVSWQSLLGCDALGVLQNKAVLGSPLPVTKNSLSDVVAKNIFSLQYAAVKITTL